MSHQEWNGSPTSPQFNMQTNCIWHFRDLDMSHVSQLNKVLMLRTAKTGRFFKANGKSITPQI